VGTLQTPEETRPFTPRRWLRGGHVQTVASFLIQRRFHLPAPEERLIEVAPGVQVLCHCHWQADRGRALAVIIVHGLEGSSDSQYVLGITEKALALGMNVIRYNQRNCGGTDALTPTLYHSGLSSDVGAVIRHFTEKFGLERVALVGYSMGGNLVLKLAGEWGARPPLVAVATVCPAIDLAVGADALHEPLNRAYEWKFRANVSDVGSNSCPDTVIPNPYNHSFHIVFNTQLRKIHFSAKNAITKGLLSNTAKGINQSSNLVSSLFLNYVNDDFRMTR